jgi:uncharacterized protein YjgD (DUF1641 family)
MIEENKQENKVTEEVILNILSQAFNMYLTLPVEQPSDTKDFADGINKCLYVIALRIARRNYEDLFPKVEIEDEIKEENKE